MRKTILTLLAGAAAISLVACQNEPETRFEKRFARFAALLTEEERISFDKQRYAEVARSLDARVRSNPERGKQLDAIKDAEAIAFFGTEQTVRFFAETIVTRRDFYALLDALDGAEKLLLKERKYDDLGRVLDARMTRDGSTRARVDSIKRTSHFEGKATAEVLRFLAEKVADY